MKGLPLKGNFNRLGIESPRTHPAVNIPLEKIILENRTNRRFKQMFNDPRTGMFYILADNDLYCANYTFDDEGNFLLRDKELVSSTIHEQDRVEGTFIVIPFTRNGIGKRSCSKRQTFPWHMCGYASAC